MKKFHCLAYPFWKSRANRASPIPYTCGALGSPPIAGAIKRDSPAGRSLVEHGLIDEFHLWRFPVIAGASDARFDGLPVIPLRL